MLQTTAMLRAAADEVTRLRAGIACVVQGEAFVQPVATPYRDDGVASRHDRCACGQPMYNGCANCAEQFLARVLSGDWPRPLAEAPQPETLARAREGEAW